MVDVRHPNHILCVLAVVILALSAFYRRRHRSIPRNTPVQSRQDRVTVITKELLGTTPLVTFTGPSSYKRKPDVEAGDRGCLEETGTEEGRARNPTTFSSLDEDYVHLACPICAEAFANGEDLWILPCSPQFHAGCVDPWLLTRSSTCPMCRTDVALPSSVVRDNPITKNGRNRAEQMEARNFCIRPSIYACLRTVSEFSVAVSCALYAFSATFWLDWRSDAETQHPGQQYRTTGASPPRTQATRRDLGGDFGAG